MYNIITKHAGFCRCQAADLSKNGIGVKGITAVTEALSHNDVLVLDTNSIGDEGAEVLAKHLTSEHHLFQSFSHALHQHVCTELVAFGSVR